MHHLLTFLSTIKIHIVILDILEISILKLHHLKENSKLFMLQNKQSISNCASPAGADCHFDIISHWTLFRFKMTSSATILPCSKISVAILLRLILLLLLLVSIRYLYVFSETDDVIEIVESLKPKGIEYNCSYFLSILKGL